MEPQMKDPYGPKDAPDNAPGDAPGDAPGPAAPDDCLPDLECAVCFRQFNNVFNTPKMLLCHHTFCLECLARINVISTQPDSIQCPLCRSFTLLPTLGLPKLDTDPAVLSCLRLPIQHVYSIRFSREQGKLQVKRVPSAAPPCPAETRRSLDLGVPADDGGGGEEGEGVVVPGRAARGRALFLRLMKMPGCRMLLMALGLLVMVTLTIVIGIFLSQRGR